MRAKIEHGKFAGSDKVDKEIAYKAFRTAEEMLKEHWTATVVENGPNGMPALTSTAPIPAMCSAIHSGFAHEMIDDDFIMAEYMPDCVTLTEGSTLRHQVFYDKREEKT